MATPACCCATTRVLNWFHLGMRFQHLLMFGALPGLRRADQGEVACCGTGNKRAAGTPRIIPARHRLGPRSQSTGAADPLFARLLALPRELSTAKCARPSDSCTAMPASPSIASLRSTSKRVGGPGARRVRPLAPAAPCPILAIACRSAARNLQRPSERARDANAPRLTALHSSLSP